MTTDQYRKQREKLGIPRETVVRREGGDQRMTEEMAIALRALRPRATKRARGPQNRV